MVGLACVAVAGCGGGERQDADEPEGSYRVEVVEAKFPSATKLAARSTLVIAVKNVDTKTIPNVAVTVKSFDQRQNDPNLADPRRPQFVVNRAPEGGDTAYVGTSALGVLRPGETKKFEWNVTAVKAGDFSLSYVVSAGLDGKAKAVLADGRAPTGRFTGEISSEAPEARVSDEDGETIIKEE